MNIQEQIKQDLRAAMVGGDKEITSLLRVILGEFSRVGKEVSDEEALSVIKKMHKNATELGNKFEMKILDEYLPRMLGPMQVKTLISGIIQANKFSGMKDMGAVMKIIKQHPMAPQMDGKLSASIVRELLSNS